MADPLAPFVIAVPGSRYNLVARIRRFARYPGDITTAKNYAGVPA